MSVRKAINVLCWCAALAMMLLCCNLSRAQRLIEYESGTGRRMPNNPNVWILSEGVKAVHEGMVLHADSALLDLKNNDFTAYGNIAIDISDTTFVYGDMLFYDATSKVAEIWDDTVLLIDGQTVLHCDHIHYNRTLNSASYTAWGITINGDDTMRSTRGIYNADRREVCVSLDVELIDGTTRLTTDSAVYFVSSETAHFWGKTTIVSDSATLYSSRGLYDAAAHYAVSFSDSRVDRDAQRLLCDTLRYYLDPEKAFATGSVAITDTAAKLTAFGGYAESNHKCGYHFITDSVLVKHYANTDTLFLHADTIKVFNDVRDSVNRIEAFHAVRLFGADFQARCDSAVYTTTDSLLQMHASPVIWYENYQCTADTIFVRIDSSGMKDARLKGNFFAIEKVDAEKYNQIKGHQTFVYCADGRPTHADVVGNAEMVYYITEERHKGTQELVGVNVGVGSSMRIYFRNNQASRIVTNQSPSMMTYPLSKLPKDKQSLQGFQWLQALRPSSVSDLFKQ